MSWTDDRVALLKRLWGEGKTAAEIAKELGGVTRNAVIGKAHRLKLSNRVSPIQQNKKPATKTAPAAPKKLQVNTQPVALTSPGDRKKIDLVDLGYGQCRWPIGDPQEDDFGFCGDRALSGLPYCMEHAKLAYQAATRNRIIKTHEEQAAPVAPQEKKKKAASA